MKKMKKILAFVMAMAMVLGMSVTALAAPEGYGDDGVKREIAENPATGTKSDTGTITVSNVTPNPEGSKKELTVTAYQIIKAEYKNDIPQGGAEDDGKFSGYANVYTADGLPKFVSATGIVDNSVITEANLATVRAYIEKQNEAGITMKANDEGTQYSASVKVGTYLVVISNAEGKIYSNMVVSVQYVNEDGSGNKLESADLYISEDAAMAKVQSNPSVTKKVVEGTDKKDGNSANIGDTVKYEITADIPTYSGSNPVYKVIDTLNGLLYKEKLIVKVVDASGATVSENVTYTIENAEGAVITEEDITNKIILNFVSETDGVKTYNLSAFAGKKLVITYDAIVDEATAKVNQDPNTNTVELEYTHNSNVSGDDETDKTDDITKTYTFDLSGTLTGDKTTSILTKTGESTSSETKKLGGAVFKLYQKDKAGNEIAYTNTAMASAEVKKNDSEEKYTTAQVTSSKDETNKGELIIRGLAAGTYYLKEVKAPDEYSLSDHEYVIVVNATIDANGELTAWDVTVDGDTLFAVTAGKVTVEADREMNGHIPNTKLSSLPSTGGIGTTIFTIGGCAIMILAAGLYFASRRKSAK